MLILSGIALMCLILGILFLVNTQALNKFSDLLNKVIIENKAISDKHSKGLGVFLIIFSAILFLIALRVRR